MFSPGSGYMARRSFSFGGRARNTADQGQAPARPVCSGGRGSTRVRKGQPLDDGLVVKGGRKHHPFDPSVAPYPLSYDPDIIEFDVLDHINMMQTRGVTCFEFRDGPPARSLDLGCGVRWVMEAARTWKDCYVVGLDLVRIQPKLHLLPPDVANRIRWIKGNFLTEKLPFEDNHFDHVHISRIGWGVSEMQWDFLFEEVARVLRPGGALEMMEEDVLFPILPRSYAIKTKQPRPSAPYPHASLTLSAPASPVDDAPYTHPHSLLESLFFGVFESRMINLRPTAIVPHHLNIHFRKTFSTPILEYPFPPPPVARQQLRHVSSDCTARPTRQGPSESMSSVSTFDSILMDDEPLHTTPLTTNSDLSRLSVPVPPPLPAAARRQFVPAQGPIGFDKAADSTSVPVKPGVSVNVSDRSLSLQLTAVSRRILACKEAMWEELRRRLLLRRAGGRDSLHGLGWDDETDANGNSGEAGRGHAQGRGRRDGAGWCEAKELERARVLFDELTARFERDMRYRSALPDALETTLRWSRPAPSPMSKHERAQEAEVERAIADAARAAEEEEAPQCLRSFRAFVGYKQEKR
ncbi:hypothetical protein JB92DRAFT_2790134 [Gautieria morchelliformis]|nr:hypothetical protein JB92DRAFT_2790134 [Gautieria morchelliformis]